MEGGKGGGRGGEKEVCIMTMPLLSTVSPHNTMTNVE